MRSFSFESVFSDQVPGLRVLDIFCDLKFDDADTGSDLASKGRGGGILN